MTATTSLPMRIGEGEGGAASEPLLSREVTRGGDVFLPGSALEVGLTRDPRARREAHAARCRP